MQTVMEPKSVEMAITSVPFPALYSYTSLESDLGNSESLDGETKLHFSFFFRGLARVLKPGRVAIIHCMQIPRMKRSGEEGLFDFRGFLIRLGTRAGLTYEYDWVVRKNPQSQALRTRSHELQFAGLEKDRAGSRGALCDYLIKFTGKGDNAIPVRSKEEVSRNDWIAWAEGSWMDIRETDTLNFQAGKAEGDTRHICPLQLSVIERCIRLYTNPGELVFDPFTGVGSTGYIALGGRSPVTGKGLQDARRFIGCELKDSYYAVAKANLAKAENSLRESQKTLFDAVV
jgi:hypothetical protein